MSLASRIKLRSNSLLILTTFYNQATPETQIILLSNAAQGS